MTILPWRPFDERRLAVAQTLYDKIWRDHLVSEREDGTGLVYIDRHLLHEVTSPQAFDGLKLAGRRPWRVDRPALLFGPLADASR